MSMRFNWGDCGPRSKGFPEALFSLAAGRSGSWGPGDWSFEWGDGRGGQQARDRGLARAGRAPQDH